MRVFDRIIREVQKMKEGLFLRRHEDRLVLYVTQSTLDEINTEFNYYKSYGFSTDNDGEPCDFRFMGCNGYVVSDRHPPFRIFAK